jgi:hypothetical protein
LPPGAYQIRVAVTGFKALNRSGLQVAAGQTLPLDLVLEIGSVSESVTVTAESTLLKTESGDIVHNVTLSQLNNLPILGVGGQNAGSNGIRNPFNSAILVPGVSFTPNFAMIVNGAPTNTAAYRIEGLDNTNHTVAFANTQSQPSPDAVEEIAIQTSNYAAEFGQAGGGLFNITMKSGTNQFHGTAYMYFVNEAFNAGQPYSFTPEGGKYRPRARRWDTGGTFGGPVRIPKLYDGRNKTFFFYSYEYFREFQDLTFTATLPNAMYQNGNFSTISPVGNAFDSTLGVPATAISTDALGRPVYANAIYDPRTRTTTAAGVGIADVFPNNIVPANRFSPVAVEIQKLYPALSNTGLYNNYNGYSPGERVGIIPSIKVDHNLTQNHKLSFFYNHTETNAQFTLPNGNADGLPDILTGARGSKPIGGPVYRLNYDATLKPTLLFHLGIGYSYIYFFDNGPYTNAGNRFDCLSIQLTGCIGKFNFPTVITANVTTPVRLGGMQQLGNALAHTATHTQRPSANANLTWIHGNHTFKGGAEMWYQGNITKPPTGVGLTFGAGATSLPASLVNSTAYSPGFAYASFLLGAVTSAQQNAPVDARMHKKQWGIFIQDSWKATRKFTLDYGLRWDYATAAHEQYGRSANLGLIPNPAVGNRIGTAVFEATCGCQFVSNYPYAIAPRLGFAYQVNPKTVIRGGWGIAYGVPSDINLQNNGNLTNAPTGINAYALLNAPGTMPQPVWPNFDPGQTPLPGATSSTFLASLDRGASRPPRQNQWSIGLQREITRNLVVEGSYVANRGVWWTGPLGYLNQIGPAGFAAYGLSPYNVPADNLLLGSAISSTAVINRVGVITPYSGYPTTNTLFNALRPYPQFQTIAVQNSPTGNTWYDSFQAKVTHRLSHGLQVNGVFTWSKSLTSIRPNLFVESEKSHASTDLPFVFNVNILYTTQNWFSNKWLSVATKDWNIGAFLQYSSGLLLTPPAATNTNFIGGSEQFRVPGEPLYLKGLNCGCINPYSDVVLNPKAWSNPANGMFGPATGLFYGDFRSARRPLENFNLGRTFRLTERVTFSIRGEFVNVLNRLQIGNPSTVAPGTPPSRNAQGQYSGGFGVINMTVSGPNTAPTATSNNVVGQLYQQPRSGTIIGRISF